MPTTARIGDVIQIKTKIRHPMETGWRKGGDGKTVSRNRITRFACTFDGTDVMSADFDSGVAADPYLLFYTKVVGAGTYDFRWEGDGGQVLITAVPLTISTM